MPTGDRDLASLDSEGWAAPEIRAWIASRTPARLLVGRAGLGYRTATQLELRRDHAAAVDAVHAELALERDLEPSFLERWRLFEVVSQARTKSEYLMRPDLGRLLSPEGAEAIKRLCPASADLQVLIGDGLSVAAIIRQVPELLPRLEQGARERGWRFGRPFIVRHCRVGVLNAIGEELDPSVCVLLIGERPGLATAESVSAYMAYHPRPGHTDAQRNLVSNIHARGVGADAAVVRIFALAEQMRHFQSSGVAIKEGLPTDSAALVPRRANHRATARGFGAACGERPASSAAMIASGSNTQPPQVPPPTC